MKLRFLQKLKDNSGRALRIWTSNERYTERDLFWFIIVNIIIIDIIVIIMSMLQAYVTGSAVLPVILFGVTTATPIAALLMYLGGSALRLNIDLRTQLEEARAALETEANRDFLTGLANRRAFSRVLEEAWLSSDDFAFIAVDLDAFKSVNDRHGHAFGDAVLIEVSKRLTQVLQGKASIIVRLGGDEFATLVMSDKLDAAGGIDELGQTLCIALQAPVTHAGTRINIGASVGVAFKSAGFANRSALAIAADMALRAAKQAGKGQMIVHTGAPIADTTLSAARRAS